MTYSYSEVAEARKISRQGVHDLIKSVQQNPGGL